jgi:hypothetical protein
MLFVCYKQMNCVYDCLWELDEPCEDSVLILLDEICVLKKSYPEIFSANLCNDKGKKLKLFLFTL